MVNARTWFTLFMLSLGTIAATASCGSTDEGTNGGASGAGGGSIISGAGRAGSVGRAGSSGGSGIPSATGLGAACVRDGDCSDGLACVTAAGGLFGGQGPSHGMCTLSCKTGNECDAFESGAACFNVNTEDDPVGFCMQACTEGDPGADLTVKCQGRTDMVCINYDRTVTDATYCTPMCRSDAECGSTLFCDKHSGLCTKTKPAKGDPVGTPCNPDGTDNCEGFCIRTSADDVTPATGACAEFCAGGFDCMINGTKPGGLCAGPLTDPSIFGALDFGYCLPNCSCSTDCKFPGDLCRAWTADESATAKFLGADGLCYTELQGSTELTCGEGGAGGAGAAGAAGSSGAAGESAGGASGESAGGAAGNGI